jgi:hypothetical protein
MTGPAKRFALGISLLVLGSAAAILLFGVRPRMQGPVAPDPRAPAKTVGAESEGDELVRAWKNVVDRPRDAAAWMALGDLQAAEEQPDAAEHSYRTAVRVSGAKGAGAYARLGFLLYGRGDDGDALAFLLEAKRRGANDAMLEFTIRAIKERTSEKDAGAKTAEVAPPLHRIDAGFSEDGGEDGIDAGEALGDGGAPTSPPVASTTPSKRRPPRIMGTMTLDDGCTVQLVRPHERGGFLVDAMLDGVPARLLIDTGATISVITRELLNQIGRAEEADRQVRVLTANGSTNMGLARIESLSVGGRVASPALVGICDECMRGVADGLLGLDVQAALGMELELGQSRVRFADCGGP